MSSNKELFRYDIKTGKVISECNLYPTDVSKDDIYWLYALNNKYDDESHDEEKTGKWMLFLKKDQVNAVWDQIKQAIIAGDLWHSKVSTYDPESPESTHAIMIYTKDYTDIPDVINVLNFLESSGIKAPDTTIKYKTDQQTLAGIYRGGGQKPWIYDSNTIRNRPPSRAPSQAPSRAPSQAPSRAPSGNWRER